MSFNSLKAEQIIAALYDQFLNPRGSMLAKTNKDYWNTDPNLAMHFQVQVSIENFGYEKDGNTPHPEWATRFDRTIHVIITGRYRVYVAVSEYHSFEKIDPAWFQNTSNHDSCWRSDGLGIIFKTLHEGCDSYLAKTPEGLSNAKYPTPNEIVASSFNSFGEGLFNVNPVQFVRVKRVPIPGDTYRDKLTAIEPVKWSISIDS